jgi:hypothetical protein
VKQPKGSVAKNILAAISCATGHMTDAIYCVAGNFLQHTDLGVLFSPSAGFPFGLRTMMQRAEPGVP